MFLELHVALGMPWKNEIHDFIHESRGHTTGAKRACHAPSAQTHESPLAFHGKLPQQRPLHVFPTESASTNFYILREPFYTKCAINLLDRYMVPSASLIGFISCDDMKSLKCASGYGTT